MKRIIVLTILVLSSISSAQKFPIQNNYSPTYQDLVVLFDIADQEFMPFFFHKIMAEYLDMSRHESCQKIKVLKVRQAMAVVCISSQNQEVAVGNLAEVVGREGFFKAYRVIWNLQSELVQSINPRNGDLSYSIVIKSKGRTL